MYIRKLFENRKNAAPVADGVNVNNPSATPSRKGRPRSILTIAGGLPFTQAQLLTTLDGIGDTAQKVVTTLKGIGPAVFFQPLAFRVNRRLGVDFIEGMADVQTNYGSLIGNTNTNPTTMRNLNLLATTVGGIAQNVELLGVFLRNVQGYSLSAAIRDARKIYHRAVAAAPDHQEVADAIARFRNVAVRTSKKAAEARKLGKEGTAQKPATPPTTPVATATPSHQ